MTDTETGFYYLNSRYYDPEVGRFLNADCIVGANGGITGYNLFAYCNNNPILFADITGEFPVNNTVLYSDLIGMTGTYAELKKLTRGTDLEVHHLLEKRFQNKMPFFRNALPTPNNSPAVILPPEDHAMITAAWRKAFPYSSASTYSYEPNYVISFYKMEYSRMGHGEWADLLAVYIH